MASTTSTSAALPPIGKELAWPKTTSTTIGKTSRNEPNLSTMPFIRPNNGSANKVIRFEWTAIGRDGMLHDFFEVFRPGRKMQLPGPTADRVMRALLSMSPSETDEGLKVIAGLGELANLCRLRKGGSTYDQIRRAIRRLKSVTVETNAFWDHDRQKYMDSSAIEIFASHHFHTEGRKKMVDVEWTSDIIDLMNTWSKPANLNHLFDLKSCLARKLYQVSSLGIYHQGQMIQDLEVLCHGQLGIRQTRDQPHEMKESLESPIETLRQKNLVDVQIEKDDCTEENERFSSGWLVRARPMGRMLELQEEVDDPQYWACQLAMRGMMNTTCDPLNECRHWVDKEGVPRTRTVVQEYDRRRSSGSDDRHVRHAGWMLSAFRNDVSFEEEETPKQKSSAPDWQI